MVPVAHRGRRHAARRSRPGLLYGDERGRTGDRTEAEAAPTTRRAGSSGSSAGWPRRRRARTASGPRRRSPTTRSRGEAVLDTTTASLAHPLFDWVGWDAAARAPSSGSGPTSCRASCPPGGRRAASAATAPRSRRGASTRWPSSSWPGPTSRATCSCCSAPRSSCGSSPREAAEVPGYVTHPAHRVGQLPRRGAEQRGRPVPRLGRCACSAPTDASASLDPGAMPVWAPYPRGERVPLNDPTRRAVLDGLDLTHDAAAVRARRRRGVGVRGEARARRRGRARRRAAPKRVVASGGGTRVDGWVQAVADVTDLPVDCVAVPDGGALGSGVVGAHRRRARGADGDDRGSAVGARRAAARAARRRGPRRRRSATSGSSRSAERRERHDLAREDQVRIARRERGAVPFAHRHPVAARSRRRRHRPVRSPRVAASRRRGQRPEVVARRHDHLHLHAARWR